MKQFKLLKKAAALAIGAMMSLTMGAAAFAADSQVIYQGGADAFVMVPENTDLFQNFKGVMPGDTLTQTITVKNTVAKSGGVKLYLKAESTDETINGFLKQMTLTVKQGDTVLSEATAEQTAGLTENVLLGSFSQNDNVNLEVMLQIPITMGNEFQDASGTIYWVFTAEEIDSTGGETGPGGGGGSSGGGGGGGRSDLTRTTTITDEAVPQAPGNPITELIQEILPDNVPLAFLPKTGDGSVDGVLLAVNIASLLLIIGLAVHFIRRRKAAKNQN